MTQTVSVNTNLDELTGRTNGEIIQITSGAVLTIDSSPTDNANKAIGDINFTGSGEINIDGRYVRLLTYNSGSGTLPTRLDSATFGTAGSGKITKFNSGNNVSGTMTIVIASGEELNGTISSGGWTATVVSSVVGFLPIYIALASGGIWDALDATNTLRIRGDKYQIGVGDGTDNQSINLPHTGHQHAIWVETGNGTDVYEIWHRVYNGEGGNSTIYFDRITDWGATYESGKVFSCVPLSGTINFGTSTAGGAPPNGARILIPNVHMGTTSTGAPTTEIGTLVLANYTQIVDSNVTQNIEIDHLNASSVQVNFVQLNTCEISNSFFGHFAATTINKNNGEINFDNCAWVSGNSMTGDILGVGFLITDNIGGVNFTDSLLYCGVNGGRGMLFLTTMANLNFIGTNKLVSNQQDENTMGTIYATVASNLYAEKLISLNGGLFSLAGSTNWNIDWLVYGQVPGRGATEDSLYHSFIISGLKISKVSICEGGNPFKGSQFSLGDSDKVIMRNLGEIDNKVDFGGVGANLINLSGISTNCLFQRLWSTNLASSQGFAMLNSCADITIENCSVDYNDENEMDANRLIVKGVHFGSGNIGTGTGTEDDLINVLATIFYDIFKSDTTGGIGLVFNDRGNKHLYDVTIDSGTPVFNGLGDLVMQAGDQITYWWPYWIKGHTDFDNVNTVCHLLGVNAGTLGTNWGNFTVQYALDTGAGYGSFSDATVANLTAETISPTGFRIAIRIICDTSNATNSIRGLQIMTTTTIAAQKANLYPLAVITLTLENIVTDSDVTIIAHGTETVLATQENISGTSFTHTYETPQAVDIVIYKPGYIPYTTLYNYMLGSSDTTLPVTQTVDVSYLE